MSKSEYSGVTSKAGGYNSLGCYHGQQGTMAPIRRESNIMRVPNYSSIGHDALTKGDANMGNSKPYFTINKAYGYGSAVGSSFAPMSYSSRNYNECDK